MSETDYKIVTNTKKEAFEKEVNRLLKDGYHLKGDMHPDGKRGYVQALLKESLGYGVRNGGI